VNLHVTDDGRPGYVETDGHTIIPIDECHIIRPEVLEMLQTLRVEKVERVRLQVGTNGDERLSAINVGDEDSPSSTSKDTVHYTIKEREYRVTAGSFFQVNLEQTEMLVNLVLDRLALTGSERVLDLYSGVGLFTAFLAERAAQVTAIEIYPPAIKDAEVNLAEFDNINLYEGTIERVLPELSQTFDVAVIDPPRAGMKPRALEALILHAPERIVYVSCDPATLARDARQLANNGYQLLDVQPVDMFPQTYHIEAVATFARLP
jgi:23S rRNA (uracil1939-C5)-methyltransferase